VCFICILSALSQKFSSLLFQKKISQKISTFLPPKKATPPFEKRYKKGEKKTTTIRPAAVPGCARALFFSDCTRRTETLPRVSNGCEKTSRTRICLFCCSDPALLFFSFFRPSFPRARKFTDNKRLQRALFFFLRSNKKCFWEKNSRFFRVNSIARNLPKLPPTRTTKTRCDWEFERASEFSASFEGEFWTSDALFYSLFFIYVCTIF